MNQKEVSALLGLDEKEKGITFTFDVQKSTRGTKARRCNVHNYTSISTDQLTIRDVPSNYMRAVLLNNQTSIAAHLVKLSICSRVPTRKAGMGMGGVGNDLGTAIDSS
ncbi:Os02g0468650 [Oryza sativa Japonica Group]|uniref:Os02g0468650 protein n=1 Tax=Oryza sativa subsp. japonica TaxID=39947 RepID=A0A0P0VIV2_ORYSJ|nr:Os02g0468650 [Oryza sativa Japonica Group]